MQKLYDGKSEQKRLLENFKSQIIKGDLNPQLGIIFVGEDKASTRYVNHKMQLAHEINIDVKLFRKLTSTTEEIINQISIWNDDENIDGILVQLPLPENINKYDIFQKISPTKDVDGFSPWNKGLMDNLLTEFIPATAKSVIHILEQSNIELKGKEVLLIGYSDLLGMPLSKYFLKNGATIKVVNEFTKSWLSQVKYYDIIVSSVGKENLFSEVEVKKNAIVIGVGVSENEKGELVGDFDHDKIVRVASLVTPTPGGVGPLTVVFLLENVIISHLKKISKKV